MFVDIANIYIKAGDGGNGKVSFRREKYVAAGGPDGGDGGRGGNIVFKADDNMSTLADFRYKRKYIAESGQPGGAARCNGRAAKDLVLYVPKGTVIKNADTGRLIADISDDEPVIIAKGGNGGWGNCHFATPTRQVPHFAKPGIPGEELNITLELKLLADVGLIGFPNVGKSTFISVVSEAKPKIANYHFTTLVPTLGVVRIAEGKSFVMADIPGIIEGASDGAGLGHEFLRHVERCRLLVHVIDASGSEGRDPIDDFEKINHELTAFSPELAERRQIVVANKCDLTDEESLAKLRKHFENLGYKYFECMAAIAEGTRDVINYIASELDSIPQIEFRVEEEPLEDFTEVKQRDFKLTVEDGVFIVEAPWLLKILETTDPDDYESLQYFQRVLRSSGIINALENAGVKEGDTVSVYDIEFDYVP